MTIAFLLRVCVWPLQVGCVGAGDVIRTLTLFFFLWHPLSDDWWLLTNRHRLHTNRHRLHTNRHRRAYWTLRVFFLFSLRHPLRWRCCAVLSACVAFTGRAVRECNCVFLVWYVSVMWPRQLGSTTSSEDYLRSGEVCISNCSRLRVLTDCTLFDRPNDVQARSAVPEFLASRLHCFDLRCSTCDVRRRVCRGRRTVFLRW